MSSHIEIIPQTSIDLSIKDIKKHIPEQYLCNFKNLCFFDIKTQQKVKGWKISKIESNPLYDLLNDDHAMGVFLCKTDSVLGIDETELTSPNFSVSDFELKKIGEIWNSCGFSINICCKNNITYTDENFVIMVYAITKAYKGYMQNMYAIEGIPSGTLFNPETWLKLLEYNE